MIRGVPVLSMYIGYISVSKPTPWAVAGPQGASNTLCQLPDSKKLRLLKQCNFFGVQTATLLSIIGPQALPQ